jgi:hypothetical protein
MDRNVAAGSDTAGPRQAQWLALVLILLLFDGPEARSGSLGRPSPRRHIHGPEPPTPTSPNSFTITATLKLCSWVRIRFGKVVFPAAGTGLEKAMEGQGEAPTPSMRMVLVLTWWASGVPPMAHRIHPPVPESMALERDGHPFTSVSRVQREPPLHG